MTHCGKTELHIMFILIINWFSHKSKHGIFPRIFHLEIKTFCDSEKERMQPYIKKYGSRSSFRCSRMMEELAAALISAMYWFLSETVRKLNLWAAFGNW